MYVLHICCIIYLVSAVVVVVVVVVCCEICGNTSPEYRSWYHFMDDFYRLPFDHVVSIPADQRVLYIPSFEIDIYVVVRDRLRRRRRRGGGGGGGRCPFPFWKNKLLWLDNNFRNITES